MGYMAAGYSTAYAESYAVRLAELAERRRMMTALQEAVNGVCDDSKTPGEVMELLNKHEVGQPASGGVSLQGALSSLWNIAQEAHDPDKKTKYVPTGLIDIDRQFGGGLYNGRAYVFAARPGVGKTSMLTQIAMAAAGSGRRVLFFSLEMTAEDVTARMAAQYAGLEASRFLAGTMTDGDWYKLNEAIIGMTHEITIYDEPNLTPERMAAIASYESRRSGCGMVVIDYLQLLNVDGNKNENRTQALGRASWAAKQIAKRLGCPVVYAAQLNRDIEKRVDKNPTMADLRESGSIEQDTDGIIFMHRKDSITPIIDVSIAKNRFGKIGQCQLRFAGESTSFQNLAR
jgi:replicative DNA helicase